MIQEEMEQLQGMLEGETQSATHNEGQCPSSYARPASAPGSIRTARTAPSTLASGRLAASTRRAAVDSLRWFWSLTITGPMTRSDRVATLGRS
jgi:hypothetical protein